MNNIVATIVAALVWIFILSFVAIIHIGLSGVKTFPGGSTSGWITFVVYTAIYWVIYFKWVEK